MRDTQTEWKILETLAEQSPLHVLDFATELDKHPTLVDIAYARLHNHIFSQSAVACTILQITDGNNLRS